MLKKIALGMIIMVILYPVLSIAQPPPGAGQHRPRGGRRSDVEARVRTMKIWKMTEEMNLTEDQAAKFFPLQNELERKLDDLDQEREVKMMELDNQVWKDDPDGKKINELLNQLEDLEKRHMELRLKFRQDVKSILSPEQIGKMVLFHQRFPGMMRAAIEEYERRCDPNRPGPPGPRW